MFLSSNKLIPLLLTFMLISTNVISKTGLEPPYVVYEEILVVNNDWNSTAGIVSGIGENGKYRTMIRLLEGSASAITFMLDLGATGSSNSENITFSDWKRLATGNIDIGDQIEISHNVEIDTCNSIIEEKLIAKNINGESGKSFIEYKFVIDEVGKNRCNEESETPLYRYYSFSPILLYLFGTGLFIYTVYWILNRKKPKITSEQYPKP